MYKFWLRANKILIELMYFALLEVRNLCVASRLYHRIRTLRLKCSTTTKKQTKKPLNIFIKKTERSIHFYWIHFLNKIVTWLTREYVYLWYRLLEINVGTWDTAKNTWGVDVNNAWRLTCKASCLKKNRVMSLDFGIWLCIVGGTESVRG
jgi:hypothetical protein